MNTPDYQALALAIDPTLYLAEVLYQVGDPPVLRYEVKQPAESGLPWTVAYEVTPLQAWKQAYQSVLCELWNGALDL